jgi:hypothetical protein
MESELRGDYSAAAKTYVRLTREGSDLDKIGIYQALARCSKLAGRLVVAAKWHLAAAQGYLSLPSDAMDRNEARYYSMLEFREACISLYPNKKSGIGKFIQHYLRTLDEYIAYSTEGISHELLYAAIISENLSHQKASYYYELAAKLMRKEGASTPLINECLRRASRLRRI